jgi:hypothetical protein
VQEKLGIVRTKRQNRAKLAGWSGDEGERVLGELCGRGVSLRVVVDVGRGRVGWSISVTGGRNATKAPGVLVSAC